MTRATTVFGARKVYELNAPGAYNKGGWRNRQIFGYASTLEEVEKFRKSPEYRGRSISYTTRWAVRLPGGWYVLSSVYPISLISYKERSRYAEINEAIKLECVPKLVYLIEGQAEQINQQGDLLDRCLIALRGMPEHKKLVGDIEHNMKEVMDDGSND